MTPKFIMHAGYQTRSVEFVLSRERRGWKFYGRDHQGYLIPARDMTNMLLLEGKAFATRKDAKALAGAVSGFPAFATWNGRKRAYDGKGAEFIAVARDAT